MMQISKYSLIFIRRRDYSTRRETIVKRNITITSLGHELGGFDQNRPQNKAIKSIEKHLPKIVSGGVFQASY